MAEARFRAGLLGFLAVRFPSFISSCGLGGMRPRAAIKRLVASNSFEALIMQNPKPWDILPREPSGDKNPDDLFREVGRALTAWEILDETQGGLFSALVGGGSSNGAAESAYGTVISWQSRSKMVAAAADDAIAIHKPALFLEIITLLNEIEKLSSRRTEIAHGKVTHFTENGIDRGYYLIPSHRNTRKQLPFKEHYKQLTSSAASDEPFYREKYAYTAKQVTAYTKHFLHYRDALLHLWYKVTNAMSERFP